MTEKRTAQDLATEILGIQALITEEGKVQSDRRVRMDLLKDKLAKLLMPSFKTTGTSVPVKVEGVGTVTLEAQPSRLQIDDIEALTDHLLTVRPKAVKAVVEIPATDLTFVQKLLADNDIEVSFTKVFVEGEDQAAYLDEVEWDDDEDKPTPRHLDPDTKELVDVPGVSVYKPAPKVSHRTAQKSRKAADQ